jgi:hypothetical protein
MASALDVPDESVNAEFRKVLGDPEVRPKQAMDVEPTPAR